MARLRYSNSGVVLVQALSHSPSLSFCQYIFYRVSHFETSYSKWLWGVERLIIFLNDGIKWLQEDWAFEFYQPVLTKITWAGLNSLCQKRYQISVKNVVFNIYSTIRDNYWSWWCQELSSHQYQSFFWSNEVIEVIDDMEAVEAVKAIEALEVLKPGKSPVRTLKSSRLLNSALFWCLKTIILE